MSLPPTPALPLDDLRPIKRSRWWVEVVIVFVFYELYSLVRDIRGRTPVSVEVAFDNAKRVIHLERWFGAFQEARIQDWVLPQRWVIEVCDDFYGTIHFIAPVVVLLLLFLKYPYRYRQWRNTLALITGLALVGFFFFPLMPPRLLPSPPYHFVDTLKTVGGLWNFSSGPVESVSNQYASMPSLHTAWSTWCCAALWSVISPKWGKALTLLLPAFTVFAIVVTANHYFLDAIAGLVLVGISHLISRRILHPLDRWARSHWSNSGDTPDRDLDVGSTTADLAGVEDTATADTGTGR